MAPKFVRVTVRARSTMPRSFWALRGLALETRLGESLSRASIYTRGVWTIEEGWRRSERGGDAWRAVRPGEG